MEKEKGQRLITFKTKSVIETDKNLAILPTAINFLPLPEERGLLDLAFFELLLEALLLLGLNTICGSLITNCSFRFLEIMPFPSLTEG